MRNKGQQQAEVHRQAAELEWKIPPVVVLVVFYVIEKKAVCRPRKMPEKHRRQRADADGTLRSASAISMRQRRRAGCRSA